MTTAQTRRVEPRVATHRTRIPRPDGAIDALVQVHERADVTLVDFCAIGALEDGETTSIRQLSELPPARPPQDSVTVPAEPVELAPPVQPVPLVLAPGGRVGKYELREKLGMGTFGLVFAARDSDLDRDVAIKVLNPAHITNRDLVQRFLQEARASARIQHPGIVTVFDSGRVPTSTGETAFIAMELLQGESLTHRLNRSGRLSPEVACEIVRQVASALDAAHRADVLHRDLKPDNIYLVPDPAVPSGERAKVFDFGLAKLGRHGHTMMNTIFGTPRSMSPEQCRSSGQIDQRSDVYALGCILFELLTGRTPFDGDLRQLIERHQRAVPPRAKSFAPEISPGLDDLIDGMLAKDPAARPQTMGALQRALEGLGARSVRVATTMLPIAAQMVALAPTPPVMLAHAARGSGPRVFDTTDELLPPPPRPPAPRPRTAPPAGPSPWGPPARNPALMLPPEGQRRRRRNVAIAAMVAFVVAGLVTAIATREQAIAGTSPPSRSARPAGAAP